MLQPLSPALKLGAHDDDLVVSSFFYSPMPAAFKLLTLLLSLACVSASPNLVKRRGSGVTTDPSTANGQTFDYIVVGAGLA